METVIFFSIALLLTVICGGFVLYPLLGNKNRLYTTPQGPQGETLQVNLRTALEERDTVYNRLRELKEDFAVGDLNEPDYDELRSRYKREAVLALVKLDQLHFRKLAEDKKDKKIEAAITAARPGLKAQGEVTRKVKSAIPSPTGEVMKTGVPLAKNSPGVIFESTSQPEGKFCLFCHNKTENRALFCPKCGKKFHEEGSNNS